MNIAKIKYILQTLLILILVSGCLPAQKSTECGSNEAFDSTKRKCVPTLGGATGNTVFIQTRFPANSYSATLGDTGITHTINVSDVYASGFTTKWKLHFSSDVSPVYNFNNSVVATNTLNYTFTPPLVTSPNLKGTYVLEAIVFNSAGSAQLDSHAWTIQVGDLAVPELINPVPSFSSTTYASNLINETLSLDIDNPDTRTGLYTWYVDSVAQGAANVFSAATSTQSIIINPSTLGVGIHTVELKITDQTNPAIIFDTYQWTVNVISPIYPNITTATPSFNDTIIAIDGIDYSSGGYLDSSYTALSALPTPGLCINVDNYDKDGNTIPDLDVQFDINGSIQGALAQIGATNQYCLTTIAAQNLVNPQIGVSKVFTVSTYVSGTGTLVEQRQWPLIITPKNSAPTIAINTDLTNSTITCSATSTLSAGGCSMTQSADTDNDNDYTDETAANNNSVQLAFSVYDLETDFTTPTNPFGEDDLEIYFQVKAAGDINYQNMDGSANQYTRTNCSLGSATSKAGMYAANQESGYSKTYICTFNMDAFYALAGDDSPTPSGNYIVRAYVRDAGSVWAPANQQQSTFITWDINVNELLSNAILSAQNFVGPATPTDSWVELSDNACTNTTTELTSGSADTPENSWIIVHSLVTDDERDNLKVLVEMENALAGPGSYTTVVPVSNVTQKYQSATGYVEAQSCFKIPEWATTSASVVANIRVTINEVTDAGLSAAVSTAIFNVNVSNNNPPPLFPDFSTRDLSLDTGGGGEPTVVYAGFPFTLNPEMVNNVTPNIATDASIYDGTNIEWQWQVRYNAGAWNDIPNANNTSMPNKTLVWTPSIDVGINANVDLRICLGDDGDGNPSDCTGAAGSQKEYTNITVVPANFQGSDGVISSGNELSSWYDQTNEILYNGYVSGTDIYISKYVKSSASSDDIHWVHDHTISFDSEDITVPLAPTIPSSLSLNGIDNTVLYVAYKVIDTGSYQPRVRQIDISDSKLSFNYHGVYSGNTADGFDMLIGTPNPAYYSLSEINGGELSIQVIAAANAGDTFTIQPTDGSASVNVPGCSAGLCASAVQSAIDIEAYINNHAVLSKELAVTRVSDTVTLRGAYIENYIDINSFTDTIGNLVIDSVNDRWYVPYRNSIGGGLSIHHGTNANQHMSNTIVATYDVAGSSTVVDYLAADISSTQALVVAQKNNAANVDVHKLTFPIGSGTVSLTNLFNVASAQVSDISLSVGASDHVYIAGRYIFNPDMGGFSDTYVCASAVKSDLLEKSSSSYFTSTNFLAQSGIGAVKVSANRAPAALGEMVIAVTTNSDHKYDNASAAGSGIPNQAHLLKVTQDTTNFADALDFKDYQINLTQLSSPKVNINPVQDNTVISLTPIYQITKGDQDETDDPADDNTKYSLFFSFHESNGGTEVRSTLLNVEANQTSTDEQSVTGSMPGILAD